jgi:hypothetical protein
MYHLHIRYTVKKDCRPYLKITMLKTLILQKLYNLSNAELEYCLQYQFSFIKFYRLELEDSIPDHFTILKNRKIIK